MAPNPNPDRASKMPSEKKVPRPVDSPDPAPRSRGSVFKLCTPAGMSRPNPPALAGRNAHHPSGLGSAPADDQNLVLTARPESIDL